MTGIRTITDFTGIGTLADYAPDPAAFNAALDRAANARGAKLVAVADPLPSADWCSGDMTCGCSICTADRQARVRTGPQGAGNASPFRRVA